MAYGYCTRCRRLYILLTQSGLCRDCGGIVEPLEDREGLRRGGKGGEVKPDGDKRPKEGKAGAGFRACPWSRYGLARRRGLERASPPFLVGSARLRWGRTCSMVARSSLDRQELHVSVPVIWSNTHAFAHALQNPIGIVILLCRVVGFAFQ